MQNSMLLVRDHVYFALIPLAAFENLRENALSC